MNTYRIDTILLPLLIAALFAAAAPSARAQSCASPIEITFPPAPYSGNTCNSTNQLDYVANGAIATNGNQDIYHFVVADGNGIALSANAQSGQELSLFVCRNQCSAHATCISAVDAVGGTAMSNSLPPGPGEYYAIVHTPNQCGAYGLTLSGPLGPAP